MRCPRDEQTKLSVNRGSHVLWQRLDEASRDLAFLHLCLHRLPYVTDESGLVGDVGCEVGGV